ncbi:MAG: hypothetical protein H7327_09680 [Herminiimonas sp.]|nr:hypothetical protein [Herminiimonas sp.]
MATTTALVPSAATAAPTHSAAALRAKYIELAPQLQNNQFQRPLYLNSAESSGALKGDIYAVVDYPFAAVNTAFNGTDHWCDMLILHLNTKYCRASGDGAASKLAVSIGKKHDQPLADAYRVDFTYAVATAATDYLDVTLNAREGPMGTSDYRILLEAVALDNGRSFIHLTYSYAYGMAARIATQAYLATVGSGKVGFTHTGKGTGQDDFIDGVRGVVERNTMRYYLAIDAYLSATTAPPGNQLEKRLKNWFAATERYPKQLREVERDDYLQMKRSEYKRQQSPQ